VIPETFFYNWTIKMHCMSNVTFYIRFHASAIDSDAAEELIYEKLNWANGNCQVVDIEPYDDNTLDFIVDLEFEPFAITKLEKELNLMTELEAIEVLEDVEFD
jgi:hypothetical protein